MHVTHFTMWSWVVHHRLTPKAEQLGCQREQSARCSTSFWRLSCGFGLILSTLNLPTLISPTKRFFCVISPTQFKMSKMVKSGWVLLKSVHKKDLIFLSQICVVEEEQIQMRAVWWSYRQMLALFWMSGVTHRRWDELSPQSCSVDYASPLHGCWFGMGRCRTCSTGEDCSAPPARYSQSTLYTG